MFRNPATFIQLENQTALPAFSSDKTTLFLNGNTSPFLYEENPSYDQDDDFLVPHQTIGSFSQQLQLQNPPINGLSSFNQDIYVLHVASFALANTSETIMDASVQDIQDFAKTCTSAKGDLKEEKLDDMLTLQVRDSITTSASIEAETNSEASSPQNQGFCRRSQRNLQGKRPEYNQQVLARQIGCLSDPSKQNLKKNFPVSIALRVRESSLKYLDFRYQGQEQIIFYLANLIQMKLPTPPERRAYKEFLTEIKFSGKTYQAIKEQFKDQTHYMETFLACIVGFLSNDGQGDFEDWLKGNKKMHETNKQLLRKDKFQLIESFQEQLSL